MKSYIASEPREALEQAMNDPEMEWTSWEKKALEKIVLGDYTSKNHGTGRVWHATGSKIQFLTQATENGYNVSVARTKFLRSVGE